MTLATRLDRLRRDCAAAAPHQPAARPASSAPCLAPGMRDRLAGALGGCRVAEGLVHTVTEVPLDDGQDGPPAARDLPETARLEQANWLYLDTETTGLSGGTGNLAFMVGVARYAAAGRLQVRQYTLGSFAAERDMLAELGGWIDRDTVLVSYNGRCFDLPLLIARYRLHRLDQQLSELPQLDLMYTVRRAYRDAWPDCRLQTAEQRRLDLHRVDDLPGAEAPAAWRAWLRAGRSGPLSRVLAHNRQDVVSLARLHAAMVEDHAGPTGGQADLRRIGLAWQAAGEAPRAVHYWERHLGRLGKAAQLELAAAYRRDGRWQDAERLWLSLYQGGCSEAACALSKYHEHRRRDYRRALAFAQTCDEPDRRLRVARLLRKLGGRTMPWNLELPLVEPVANRYQAAGLPAVSMK
jgi:hypothetical protein